MFFRFKLLVAVLGCVTFAQSREASASIMFNLITNNGEANVTSQLLADVTDDGGDVLFTFSNAGPIASTINSIYLLDLTGSLLTGPPTIVNSTGTSYQALSNKNFSGFPEAATFAFKPVPPPATNGVDPGEWVGFKFAGTLADVQSAIASADLFLGLHVISIDNAGSEKYVNTESGITTEFNPVPEPSTVLIWSLLAVGAAGVFGRRRTR